MTRVLILVIMAMAAIMSTSDAITTTTTTTIAGTTTTTTTTIGATTSTTTTSTSTSTSTTTTSTTASSHTNLIDADVQALRQSLTVDQKIGQLLQLDISQFMKIDGIPFDLDVDKLKLFMSIYQFGSILNSPTSGIGLLPAPSSTQWRTMITTIQSIATTIGAKIPIIYGLDTVHGANYISDAVMFPQQLGLAATFNDTHAYITGATGGKDTRYVGIPWVFSPILGVASHQVWPRLYETFGEDPLLVTRMGKSIIQGYQGDGTAKSLQQPDKVAACMKHFIGYPNPRNGQDRGPSWIPLPTLHDIYFPSFQGAVDVNVRTAMSAYHELNNEAIGSSNSILRGILRDEMGFQGMLVTDYNVISDLTFLHHVAENTLEGTALSLQHTSIDMLMTDSQVDLITNIQTLVSTGRLNISRIDESVDRILQLKKDLGLLTNPYPPAELPASVPKPQPPAIPVATSSTPMHTLSHPSYAIHNTVGSDDDVMAALNAARESITLVENRDSYLPIVTNKTPSPYGGTSVNRIAVIGPSGNSTALLSGGWSVHWQGGSEQEYITIPGSTTLVASLQQLIDTPIEYAPGCNLDGSGGDDMINTAVAVAQRADVVVLATGERTYAEAPGNLEDLSLPLGQQRLISAIYATGKPVVLVLIQGRPLILHGMSDAAKAVILAYLPGPSGGQAIAEVIFGLTNPSGRLPFTYPRTPHQIPLQYWHTPSMAAITPQWSFGHGMSYSNIQLSNISLTPTSVSLADFTSLTVTVTVTNNSNRPARYSVLLFVSDDIRSFIPPEMKRLRDYTKIIIDGNQQQLITFTLPRSSFEFTNLQMLKQIEPGTFTIRIGPDDALTASFRINP